MAKKEIKSKLEKLLEAIKMVEKQIGDSEMGWKNQGWSKN